jgi:hypothetical protein
MKEQTFYNLNNKLDKILKIYREAYPSATIARTYENSVYQNIRNEVQAITQKLMDEVKGLRSQRDPSQEGGIYSLEQAEASLRHLQEAAAQIPTPQPASPQIQENPEDILHFDNQGRIISRGRRIRRTSINLPDYDNNPEI